jgi:DNA primase
MMSIDLEHIRNRNPIEDVVNEKFSLRKSGNRFVGVEHDSLVVTPRTHFYFWNSQGEFGDVFDFTGRHLLNYGTAWNNRDAAMFMEAVRYLAQRAGITLETSTDLKRSASWNERQLVTRLHETLLAHQPALDYATQRRGWQMTTIRAASRTSSQ